MTHSDKNEIYDLLIHLFENDISDEQRERLLAWSRNAPEASKIYWSFAKDIAIIRSHLSGQNQLEDDALNDTEFDQAIWAAMAEYETNAPIVEIEPESDASESFHQVKPEKAPRVINKFSLYTAMISAAAMLFAVLYVKYAPIHTAPVIGRLTRTIDAQWQDASGQIVQGCDLYAGPVKLLKGLAEVRFDNGVKLILEGPAEVEFESPEQIYLGSGNVVINVSSSDDQHFVVRSDKCSIVDYGTEFGASVTRDGQVRVDVFDGSVSLRDSYNPLSFHTSLLLEKGERGEVSHEGRLSKMTFNTSAFVREDEFDIHIIAQNNPYYRWKAYQYHLHKDPDLVAHYTFEKDAARDDMLVNSAPVTGPALNGVLGEPDFTESGSDGHHPAWITGRWSNKTALSFKEAASGVVVPPNGAFQITGPITLCAWIKITGENTGGAIIDCRDEYKINYHLYLQANSDTEVMEFRRYYATELEDRSWSVDCRIPKNTWSLISVTHDNHVIRYYLNGDLIGQVPYEFQAPEAVPGELMIGNAVFPWASPFKNDIGELAVLKRAMSSDEIRQMYQAGRSR